jgi:hypothetical protein
MKPKTEFASISSDDQSANVLHDYRSIRQEKRDANLIEYHKLMGDAPEQLKAELSHLNTVGPGVRKLAEKTLARWPETDLLNPQTQTARAVRALQDHCHGALNHLSNSVTAIGRLINLISTRDARLTDASPEVRAQADWVSVKGLVSGKKSFTDFAERTAYLEEAATAAVKKALENERQGRGAPVSSMSGPVNEAKEGRIVRNISQDD